MWVWSQQKLVWTSGARFKPGQFKIMRHIEECRLEEQLLFDGVHKMMDEQEYCAWMQKPKNGAISPVVSAVEFKKLWEHPKTIRDMQGQKADFKRRIAVDTGDYITNHQSRGSMLGI